MAKAKPLNSAQALCRSLREDAKLSQRELSEIIGLSQARIAQIETGRARLRDSEKDVYSYYFKMDRRRFDDAYIYRRWDSVGTIRDILKERGISARDFGKMFGIIPERASSVLCPTSNNRILFTRDEIREVAKALRVSPKVFDKDVTSVKKPIPRKPLVYVGQVEVKKEEPEMTDATEPIVENTHSTDIVQEEIENLKKENQNLKAIIVEKQRQLDILQEEKDCFAIDEQSYQDKILIAEQEADRYKKMAEESAATLKDALDEVDAIKSELVRYKDILLTILLKEYSRSV